MCSLTILRIFSLTVITETKPTYNDQLYAAVMHYHAFKEDHTKVLQLLDQARTSRITLTAEILSRALKACIGLKNMDVALKIFQEASNSRLLGNALFLRVWFYTCGMLGAPALLQTTWSAIRKANDMPIDESVWIQVVASYCMCGNFIGALHVLSDSLLDSAISIKLSVLYPSNVLNRTALLGGLNFLPPRVKSKIRHEWRVPVVVDSYLPNQTVTFISEMNAAPRFSDTDREQFAGLVNEWIGLYHSTANSHVSQSEYDESRRALLNIRLPPAAEEETQSTSEAETIEPDDQEHELAIPQSKISKSL